jgi:hypothetical protein
MIVLNELIGTGVRRLELYADDVAEVSSIPGAISGSEVQTIDNRRFTVCEGVAEVFEQLEGGEPLWPSHSPSEF